MKSTITKRGDRNEKSEGMERGNRPISRLPMLPMRGGRGRLGAAGKMLPQDAMTPPPVDSGPAIRPAPAAAAQSALNSAQLSPMSSRIGAVAPTAQAQQVAGAAMQKMPSPNFVPQANSMQNAASSSGLAPAMKRGGSVRNKPAAKFYSGGSTSKASSRGDGIAQRGKTKGRYI